MILTTVPTDPDTGVNESIIGTGAGTNVNPGIKSIPPGVITLMLPDNPSKIAATILLKKLR